MEGMATAFWIGTQRVKILFLAVDPALKSRPGAYRLRGSFDSDSHGLLHLMRQIHSQFQLLKAPFTSRPEEVQPPFSDTGLGALSFGEGARWIANSELTDMEDFGLLAEALLGFVQFHPADSNMEAAFLFPSDESRVSSV